MIPDFDDSPNASPEHGNGRVTHHTPRLPGRSRALHFRTLCTLIALAAAVLPGGPGLPHAGTAAPPGPRVVLEVRGEPLNLAARLAELNPLGVRIRLSGLGYALIEAQADQLPAIAAALPQHRVLFSASEPFTLVQVQEKALDARGRALVESSTIYRDEREAMRVLALSPAEIATYVQAAREAPARDRRGELGSIEVAGAHALPLPESMSPRALAPLPAAEQDHRYRRSRLADPAARARALGLAALVSADRIEQIVRDLSTGPGATRFTARPEFNAFAREYVADTLRAIFSAPGDTVILEPLTVDIGGAEYTVFNVIARRPGLRPGSGRYILGGHYDTIAAETPGWDPATGPAPGADDNASGTATVIEAARILTQSRFDFDLEVVLFAAEEQGLLGSKAYTADSALAALDEVLGVIVLDMVGYNPRAADSLNVITNLTSEWLADLMSEAERTLDEADGFEWFDKVIAPAFGRSDHGPFWSAGESALLLIENIDVEAHNPNYHRVTDTLDYLLAADGPDLMRRTAEVLVVTLGQFAEGAAEPPVAFALPGGRLFLYDSGGVLVVETVAGQWLEVRARLLNAGVARAAPIDVNAVLSVDGLVSAEVDTVFPTWGRGEWYEVVVPWRPGEEHAGGTVQVEMGLTLVQNETVVAQLDGTAGVAVSDLVVREAYVMPNPVRGSLAAGELKMRLTGAVDLRCRIVDAAGAEVGAYSEEVGRGQRVGLDLLTGGRDLPSGVYILRYEARVPGGGGVVARQSLPFAYTR